MALPPSVMTGEEIQDLVAQTVKDHNGRVMPYLRDKASHPFALEILAVTVPQYVLTPQIDYYRGKCDLIKHILRHEASILG